jgi:hypothetical protein
MCCFSQPVESVSNTEIYARKSSGTGQFLLYSMRYRAKEDLAMILPLPVPQPATEDDVRFINLEKHADFFAQLGRGFPRTRSSLSAGAGTAGSAAASPLKVVEVGSFQASFVPTVKDFSRLDVRFQLPKGTWESLPTYQDYGFAVFKLKQGVERVHPMAFEFPRRNPRRIFFPTVHIHDGKVHDHAHFDHTLYCQADGHESELAQWEESPRHAGAFMTFPVQQNLVSLSHHVYRRQIVGRQKNIDTVL